MHGNAIKEWIYFTVTLMFHNYRRENTIIITYLVIGKRQGKGRGK